jgi:hypothetical protein
MKNYRLSGCKNIKLPASFILDNIVAFSTLFPSTSNLKDRLLLLSVAIKEDVISVPLFQNETEFVLYIKSKS